jgi:hypothetical protein
MFNRIIYGDSTAIFTIVAFAFAASIFITISWRALRMKRPQIAHYENLPFLTATPASVACDDEGGAGQEAHPKSDATPLHRT